MTDVKSASKEILKFNASVISHLHTLFASSSFLCALLVGCYLHYYKIVQNSSFGYPEEWFPSVSATIGDRYPERSVFQIIIALTAGPRFLLIAFNFVSLFKQDSYLPYIALISGTLRTFTAGGWMYVTSTDHHDAHDVFMISYMVLTIPWTVATTLLSPKGSYQRKARFYSAVSFFGTIFPLIYWFIQHKVHVRPGAYSIYAYFEWGLIFFDILFDSWSAIDFKKIEISINSSGVEFKQQSKIVVQQVEKFESLQFIINIVNSYMYWTVVTSLFLCVWYFPLWHMGLSGYEAVIVSMFIAPILIAPRFIKDNLAKYPQITRILTVIFGIGSYKLQDPEQKLISITVGTIFGVISTITEFQALSNQPKKVHSYIVSFVIGLLTTSVLKYGNYSNNPIWPIMHSENGGYNEIGILLGLLAAFFTETSLSDKVQNDKVSTQLKGSLILGAIGFGGHYFSITSFLSDSGTLALWSWEGFPIRGPTPVTGAIPHFAAFILGIIFIVKTHPNSVTSWSYNFIVGGGSALVLFCFKNWVGFVGSSIYTFYLVSITPTIWQSINGYDLSSTFFIGFLVNIILSLGSVWVVAYAFVPGGPLLRERTNVILTMSYLAILCGIGNYKFRKESMEKVKVTSLNLFKHTMTYLTIITALILAIFIKRYPSEIPKPYNADSQSFTAGIWCVHFGLDNDMWSSETRMKNLLQEAQVDIIGLLETDTQRLIGGNRDFTQKIAEDLGMYVDYGPGPNKHTWGAALLSKFPIIKSQHHLLPSPVGELAPAIHATLNIYGQHVDVVVFHSGQEEDVEDRRLQSLALEEIMAQSTNPMVLLSYLVTEPLVGNYNTYVSDKSRMYDIDSTDWDRWCEYILFRNLKKVAYARISRSTITDTELQIGKFKLLNDEEWNDTDLDFYYGNHFVDEHSVNKNLRMPDLFKGDGVRGHRYHVFDEPRYFAQEKWQIKPHLENLD